MVASGRHPRYFTCTRLRKSTTGRMRFDFRALSAAGTPSQVLDLVHAPPDVAIPANVAVHAVYCLAKTAVSRPLTNGDESRAVRLLRAVSTARDLSSRDISKSASALGKLWSSRFCWSPLVGSCAVCRQEVHALRLRSDPF